MPVSQEVRRVNNIDGMRPITSHVIFLRLLELLTPKQKVDMDVPLALYNIRIYQGFKRKYKKVLNVLSKGRSKDCGKIHTNTYNWINTLIRIGDVNLESRSKNIQRQAKGTDRNMDLYQGGYPVGICVYNVI